MVIVKKPMITQQNLILEVLYKHFRISQDKFCAFYFFQALLNNYPKNAM